MLTEEQKEKAVKQFKRHIGIELASVYSMHGYQELAISEAELITELAILLHKRLSGQDVPISLEMANGKLRGRYGAKTEVVQR